MDKASRARHRDGSWDAGR